MRKAAMAKRKRRSTARPHRPANRVKAAMDGRTQRALEDIAMPPTPRPPAPNEIAEHLNGVALGLAAAFEELSKLRHEIGVAERIEPKRRNVE